MACAAGHGSVGALACDDPAVQARGADPRQLLQGGGAAGAGGRGGAADLSVVRRQWPAATPGAGAKIAIAGAPALAADGPWALFRLFDKGTPQAGAQPGLVRLAFAPDAGHRATLELQPTSVNNPFQSRELYDFQCPGQK